MIFASLLLFAGCDDTNFNEGIEGDTIATVLEGNCFSCHAGATADASLDLAHTHDDERIADPCELLSLSSLRGDPLVVAGDPEASVLYQRIVDEANPMPPKGAAEMLSDTNVGVVYDWIKTGAGDCRVTSVDDDDGDDTGVGSVESFAQVWDSTIQGACSGCHSAGSPAGGVDLSDRTTAYTSLLAGYVIPGDAVNSMLIELVTTDDMQIRMPPNGSPLSETEVAALTEWINNGAAE